MIRDLLLPVELCVVPTAREDDGLARSSRNRFLTSSERLQAGAVHRGLTKAKTAFEEGERRESVLTGLVRAELARIIDVAVQYVALSDPETLQDVGEVVGSKGAILSLAVKLPESGTRLIDNELLGCVL